MRKYGDYSDLNEVTASQIKEIINEIEARDIDCTIFYGFPLIELDNTTTIMKGVYYKPKRYYYSSRFFR